MSDLISRQVAIGAYCEMCSLKGKDICPDPCKELRVLMDLPSAQQWIPCSVRLPEEHEWIGTKKFGTTISNPVHITFDVNGERFVKVMSLQNGELSNSNKKTMDVFHKGWKMLAWMPLPEPYKEDNNE